MSPPPACCGCWTDHWPALKEQKVATTKVSARSRYFAGGAFLPGLDLGGLSSPRGSSDVESRSYCRFGMAERAKRSGTVIGLKVQGQLRLSLRLEGCRLGAAFAEGGSPHKQVNSFFFDKKRRRSSQFFLPNIISKTGCPFSGLVLGLSVPHPEKLGTAGWLLDGPSTFNTARTPRFDRGTTRSPCKVSIHSSMMPNCAFVESRNAENAETGRTPDTINPSQVADLSVAHNVQVETMDRSLRTQSEWGRLGPEDRSDLPDVYAGHPETRQLWTGKHRKAVLQNDTHLGIGASSARRGCRRSC